MPKLRGVREGRGLEVEEEVDLCIGRRAVGESAVGVFVIDVAAFMWDRIRRVSATTQTQIDTAKWITIGDIVLSAAVTVVFFILSTNFIELYGADGQLNMAGTGEGTVAIRRPA